MDTAKKLLLLMCMILLIGSAIPLVSSSPAITFLSQSPADLNITNAQNNKVYISFNVTDANLNDTSVKLYYKANSTTDNTMFFLNGTAYSGYFDDSYSLSPRTNITSNYTWTLLDNEIYTGTYNTGAVTIDNKVHNKVTTSNANDYYKTEYYNVSGTKQWGYFEIMANSTAGASPSSVYYCNNSYTTGNILTNNNCALISTRLATTTYDHCHTNSSCHIGFQFAVNVTSQTIGSVKVTSTSYFVFGGAKNWNVFDIAETTRTGMTQSTGNKGVGWSSQTYTIDQHLHQFDNSENQTFYYYVCANDTLGNYGCSTPRIDLMEMAGLPPSSPQVYSPVENTYNIGDLISINYTASLSPNAYDISFYNISLANIDGTFNTTIIGNNSLELGYIWDTTGTPAGEYEIKVRATDVLSQSSLGYSDNFTLQVPCGSSENPCPIYNWTDLNNTRNNLTMSYILMANLSSSDLDYEGIGDSWIPIGTELDVFSGSFDGDYNTISDLIINLPEENHIGLFNQVGDGGSISNLGLININLTGSRFVGGLAGWLGTGIIINSYSTGNVSGNNGWTGGLVGSIEGGTINNSYSTSLISGTSSCGGLTGSSDTIIENSYATGNVVCSNSNVGGLAGTQNGGTINNSYSTGNVSGNGEIGGLVGYLYSGTLENSYSIGNVVVGGGSSGGLVGTVYIGTINNSYYDTETSGKSDNDGRGIPKTTLEMKSISTFTGWDIGLTSTDLNNGYPYLAWQDNNNSYVWLGTSFDIAPPTINIIFPLDTSYNYEITTLNYSYSDSSPDSCWYSTDEGATNSTPVNAGTNFTGLTSTEGSNTWVLYCNDTSGNEVLDSVTFTYDITPPTIEITSPTNTTYTNSLTQLVEISSDGDNVWYNWDGNNVTYTTPINITFVEGSNTLIAYANDTAGNTNQTEVTFEITLPIINLDVIYPTTDINVTQNEFFNVTLNVSCSNGDCGDIEVSLDPLKVSGVVNYNYWWDYGLGLWDTSADLDGSGVDTSDYVAWTSGTLTGTCTSIIGELAGVYNWDICIVEGYDCIFSTDGQESIAIGDAFSIYDTEEECLASFSGSSKTGLISTTEGDTPFYTNGSNPQIINLNNSQSELVTFWVNATGEIDIIHTFYAYANISSNKAIGNTTATWLVTIKSGEAPPEEVTINVLPVSDVTLNGGTTKDINVLFETSSANVDDTSAQVILTNGAVERTSSGCTNVSTTFNCTITFNFYDEAGVWNINASILDNSANLITNTTESLVVNALDYVTQDVNYFAWSGALTLGVDNQEASNIITLTNGGNQDYATLNIKGQNATGVTYAEVLLADKFSIDNVTSSIAGIHLEDNTDVDMSSILNLNSHGASVSTNIYAYVDVPLGIRADNYLSSTAWGITLI